MSATDLLTLDTVAARLSVYDLRGSRATAWLDAGASLPQVGYLLGDDAASQQIGVEPRDELARVYAGLASHAQTGTAPELRPRRPGRPRRELGPSRR